MGSHDVMVCKHVFIFSHFDWICCDGTEGVCMYVCASLWLCVCVCVWQRCSPNGWINSDEIFYKGGRRGEVSALYIQSWILSFKTCMTTTTTTTKQASIETVKRITTTKRWLPIWLDFWLNGENIHSDVAENVLKMQRLYRVIGRILNNWFKIIISLHKRMCML